MYPTVHLYISTHSDEKSPNYGYSDHRQLMPNRARNGSLQMLRDMKNSTKHSSYSCNKGGVKKKNKIIASLG